MRVCVCVSYSDGLIAAVGPADVIRAQYDESCFDQVIDAAGMCVLPGELPSGLSVFPALFQPGNKMNIRLQCFLLSRAGGRSHTPGLGRRQGARVCHEGELFFFSLTSDPYF